MLRFTQKRFFYPVCAFLVASLCLLGASVFEGFYPFGDKTILTVDLYFQYTPMLSHLREGLLSGNLSLYSFTVGMGTNMIPLAAYYLMSPFNVLLIFFPQRLLAEAILFIIMLKLSLSAATCAFSLQSIYKRKNPLVLISSIGYALSMYSIAYAWNIMWLDVLILFPLVIAALERMLRTKKIGWYILLLSLCMIINYYIAFMVCVFLIMYLVYCLVRDGHSFLENVFAFFRFGVSSLVSVMCSLGVILPVYFSSKSISASVASESNLVSQSEIIDLFGRTLFGSSPTIRSGNLPNMYCGVLILFAFAIFFTVSSFSKRRKLCAVGLISLILLFMLLQPLDLLWHCMHAPNDLPYRYSFVLCFVLSMFAFETFINIESIKSKGILKALACIFACIVLFDAVTMENLVSKSMIVYGSLFALVIYCVWMYCFATERISLVFTSVALLVLCSIELMFSSVSTFNLVNKNEHFCKHDCYVDNERTENLNSTFDEIQLKDRGFYRQEHFPVFTCVDTALYGYRGITTFSSSNPQNLIKFLNRLGYCTNGINSCMYRDFVKTTDSLFGIKYLTSSIDLENKDDLKRVDLSNQSLKTYENILALPIAFAARSEVKDFVLSKSAGPFNAQELLFRTLSGENEVLFNPYTFDENDVDNNVFCVSNSKPIELQINENSSSDVYIYVECKDAGKITIRNGDKSFEQKNVREPYIINIGKVNKGQTVSVIVVPPAEKPDLKLRGCVYATEINEDGFEKIFAFFKKSPLEISSFSDTRINGKISTNDGGVLFTSIPYDEGWTVKIDGKRVETFAVGSALLGCEIDSGIHTVELSFSPRGFVLGIVVSIISILLTLLYCLVIQEHLAKRSDKVYVENIGDFVDEERTNNETFADVISNEMSVSDCS